MSLFSGPSIASEIGAYDYERPGLSNETASEVPESTPEQRKEERDQPTRVPSPSKSSEKEQLPRQPSPCKSLETPLRRATGLGLTRPLRPIPRFFGRQAEAFDHLQALLDEGIFKREHLGFFAQEFREGGGRRFCVDTFAGFCFANWHKNLHWYEVIVEDQPAWLYFDLEFNRVVNSDLDCSSVWDAFKETFCNFCDEVLGSAVDDTSLVVLDSTTTKKWSKHVIVKRLRGATGATSNLCFQNNAQIGLLVEKFVEFAAIRSESDPLSPARRLFVRASEETEVGACVVDVSVYSRNRSFRLMNCCKFGKDVPLSLQKEGFGEKLLSLGAPMQQLLTLVTYIPPGDRNTMFQHSIIPANFGHANVNHGPAGNVATNSSRPASGAAVTGSSACRTTPGGTEAAILRHIFAYWDQIRKQVEDPPPIGHGPATENSRWRPSGDPQYLSVTLGGNRFCHNMGRSHKSNHIYLVIDLVNGTFWQKCHDSDSCRHFRTAEFPLPPLHLFATGDHSNLPS